CNDNPPEGQVKCAYPADINRNGAVDPLDDSFGNSAGSAEGNFPSGGRSAGVSRGTTAIEAHTYVSKRFKYLEPYTGFAALIEFQTKRSDFGATDLEGSLVNHPPLRGTVTAGVAVIPWEQVEKFQRVSFDFRFQGTYVSEGRDYSELFDALGSSDADSLRTPNFDSYRANTLGSPTGEVDPFIPSVVDPNSEKIYTTGITNVQQHGVYDIKGQFTWQAGRYVSFDLGAAAKIIQGHLLTVDQPCNLSFNGNPEEAGPCKYTTGESDNGNPIWRADGSPNANHRKVINDTGRRFLVDTSVGWSAWIQASVLF
ncbi:MAG: hypothetical protein MK135_06195, partial [Polyangiaceae bacterium]|nr:hypothetical protein [Polyangiaceae bacterium]